MVDDIGYLDALSAQFVALVGHASLGAGLEGKMIKGGRNTKSTVDARIVFRRDVWNSLRFHKGDKLIAPDIEEEVPDAPAFFDLYRIRDYWLESQNTLVKLPGLVEVKRGKNDVGKSFVTHGYHSLKFKCERHGTSQKKLQRAKSQQ